MNNQKTIGEEFGGNELQFHVAERDNRNRQRKASCRGRCGAPSEITHESKTDLIRFEFKPVLMLCTFISVLKRQRQEGHEFDSSLHYTASSRPAWDSIPISESQNNDNTNNN